MRYWFVWCVLVLGAGYSFVEAKPASVVSKDEGITYVCDRCGIKLPTTDKSFKTRYCSGTKDQPHSKITMRRSN